MSTIGEPAYAATIPSAPLSVVARGGDAVGTMTVTWLKPANLGAASKPRYFVAKATENGAFGLAVDTGTNKSVILPCAGATKCRFVVYAQTKAGRGPGSAIATGTWARPAAPAIKTVTAGPALARMTVSINSPANTGGKAILGYLYDFQVNGAGAWVGPFAVPTLPTAQLACTSASPSGGCSYRVYARNALGASAPSAVLAGTWALPSAPVISVVNPGRPAHAATINWHPGPSTGGLANTYRYEVSADGGTFVPGAGPLPASPTIATVECPGTFLCSYRLTAVSAKGSSAVSNTVSTGFGVPTKTLNLAAYASALNLGPGSPSVNVTWSLPANLGGSPITHYEGRRCYANCDETSSLWNFATVEQLGATPTWSTTCSAGVVTCSYQVRAVNDVGPGPWGTSVRLIPFASTNVVATTAAPAGNVSVTWSGPAESGQGIDHYRLYSCVTTTGCSSSANWQNTGLVIPGTASSAVHNCGIGVECTYKVVAYERNTGGAGAASAGAAATGSSPADAPQNLTAASGTSIGAVDLAWSPPSNAGTFPVSDYVFQRSVNSGPYSGDNSIGGTATTYTDTACGASNFCTYRVAAVTAAGVGAYSNTATAEGANVPSAPPNLTATPGGAPGHVDLIWQLPTDNGGWLVTGYFVERSLDGGTTWPTNWTQGTSLSFTDTTCGAGVTCTYRVSGINARGTGPASNQATAIGTNLDPPVNLTATTSTTTLGGVLLSWGPPADDGGSPILGYEFRYKQDAGAFSAWASTGTGTGTTFTHVCFSDNVDRLCTYEVRAFTANSTSSPSNQASAQGLTDHVAPTVTVTTPSNSSFVASTTPTLSGAAGNALGDSTTVTVTVKQSSTIIRTFSVTRSGASWSVGAVQWASDSPSSLGNGAYTVQATQSDWASNIGTSNTNSFTVDTVAPTVVVTAPIANTVYLSAGRVTTADPTWPCTTPGICGTASDGASGVNNVKVSVRQGTGNYWDPATSTFSSASEVFCTSGTAACIVTGTTSWNVAFPIANFPAGGAYTARAVGQDNVLNSSAGTSVTFNIDYDPANTVFVATTGNSLNSGTTPAAPKPTIAEGLTVSSSTGRTALAIATGSYTGGVSISGSALNGRRLLGGFSTSTWKRAAPNSGGNGTSVSGLGTGVAVSVTTGVVIQTLDITATTSGVAGASTYGVRLDTGASATIAGVSITAGNGVAGSGGTAGTAGAAGTAGGFGTNGHDGNCNDGVGGGAGTGSGGARNGGAGGAGGCGNVTGTGGGTGNTSGNGNGGGGGGSGSGNIFCNNANPGGGGNGASTGGTHGSPGGSAGSVALGTATLYTPTTGGTGTTGNAGHGGGGGGGGGGHNGGICTDPDRGGGGGGGGGGGAGGGAGSGGTGAGGSFGIYAVNASVTLDTSLVFVNVTAGSGAIGGTGGNGAGGGSGGAGGRGGGLHRTGSNTDPATSEGNSPSGSPDGGPGGGGGGGSGAGGASGAGGGAGGPSISVYHNGTGTATVGTSTLARVGGGSGGAGGAGGTSGGAGAAGPIPAGSYTTGVNAGSAGVAGPGGSAVSGTTGSTGTTCRLHNGGSCTTA
jgi:hypothetical protein